MPLNSARSAEQTSRQRLTADERRTQIFAASTEILASKGYANATLTEIAERAGVAKGLLWHYFADRDDLMAQTLRHLAQQVREAIVTDLDLTADVPQVIRAVLARTAMLTRTHPTELEAIDEIVHNLRSPDGHQKITMRDYDATYAEHERLLARGQSEGSIRDGDIRVMAVSYQGIIDAMIGYLQAHPEADPQRQSTAVADVLLTGITTNRCRAQRQAHQTAQ
jgi:AcrR family transcriptional regulator